VDGVDRVPAGRVRRLDLGIAGGLAVLVAATLLAGNAAWRRALWYDEVWRAYQASLPGDRFFAELSRAAGPDALGWLAATRLAGGVLGWHAWAARTVQLAAVTALAAALYLLARRFVGRVGAAACALLAVFNQAVLDQGTQLKPYAVEMLAAVLIVAVWIGAPRPGTPGGTRGRLLRFGAVGAVSLLMLPAPFVVGPLAAADALSAPGVRAKARAAAETLVAVLPVALHLLLYVAPQSALRRSHFWDANFLAGNGPGFVTDQLGRLLHDVPPNVRLAPLAAHGALSSWLGYALAALPWLFAVCLPAGVVALARGHPGRLVLATVVGAQGLMLLASAARAWPFGAVRTNFFLVPLLLLVAVAGGCQLARWGRRAVPAWAVAVPAALALLLVGSLAAGGSAWMWQHRNGPRYGDQMPVVALRIRATMSPGDLIFATSMAFYNLRYLLDVGVDGGPQATVLPRPSDQDIWPAGAAGAGAVRAVVDRRERWRGLPDHVFLLLAPGSTGQSYRDYKQELREVGYCTAPGQVTSYPTTGLLTVLVPCG
jgi:4-amino-4-deoxy-L-arabinose transferase-like glycosyltransferase